MTTIDPSEPRWKTPREFAEFMGIHGVDEIGSPLELDGAHADMLCAGIAELLEEVTKLRAELAVIEKAHMDIVDLWTRAQDEIEKLRKELADETLRRR